MALAGLAKLHRENLGELPISRTIRTKRALRIGINGSIMGDLLTTVGSQIDEDIEMIRACGYNFHTPSTPNPSEE